MTAKSACWLKRHHLIHACSYASWDIRKSQSEASRSTSMKQDRLLCSSKRFLRLPLIVAKMLMNSGFGVACAKGWPRSHQAGRRHQKLTRTEQLADRLACG